MPQCYCAVPMLCGNDGGLSAGERRHAGYRAAEITRARAGNRPKATRDRARLSDADEGRIS
jgi:hypothetical protein